MSAHVKITNWNTDGNASIPTGTANIGNVGLIAGTASVGSVGLLAGTATVGSVGLIAGTANAGYIVSTEQGGLFRYGTVVTAINYASFALVTSAANQILVTSAAAKQIVLVSGVYSASPAMTVQFFSAGTSVSGNMPVLASTPVVLNHNRDGWLITTAGQSLTVTPSVSGNFSGALSYLLV